MAGTAKESKLGSGLCDPKQDRIVIGVDEAGYGPNIGPLIVAGSAWRVPAEIGEERFESLLGKHFCARPWSDGCAHVPLGDSKQLYNPSVGLRTLEAGLLALMAQLTPGITVPVQNDCQPTPRKSVKPKSVRQLGGFQMLLDCIANRTASAWHPTGHDWYNKLPVELPVTLPAEEILRLACLAEKRLARYGIELLAVRACIVTESRFNQMVQRFGSKGRLLSTVTMELVTELLSAYANSAVDVFCDRQGGRKKYSCVLLEAMPDEWFDTLDEAPMRSSYRRQRAPHLQFHFTVGGDSFPPTALASMTAKYVRERLMSTINQYWLEHVADLKPTAGYPGDARRFREQIENAATRLGHAVGDWWRVC
jgi:hypothetical protein